MTKAQKAERAEALARMHEWVKPGDTVYTILDHVSRSGMSRNIRVLLLKTDKRTGEPVPLHPNWAVGTIIGAPRASKGDGFRVGGCGMDMGFHTVYTLSHYLYPDGFGCIGEGCPSNDHSNGDRDYTPQAHCPKCGARFHQLSGGTEGCVVHGIVFPREFNTRVHWHRDGGYALKSRWL